MSVAKISLMLTMKQLYIHKWCYVKWNAFQRSLRERKHAQISLFAQYLNMLMKAISHSRRVLKKCHNEASATWHPAILLCVVHAYLLNWRYTYGRVDWRCERRIARSLGYTHQQYIRTHCFRQMLRNNENVYRREIFLFIAWRVEE